MKVSQQITVFVAIVGYVSCQSFNDINDVDDVKKKLEDTVPGFNDLDIEERLNKTKLPKIEEVENVLKEKCKQNGAEGAMEALQEQQDIVRTCVESYINMTVVQEELEKAKETGSMDEVFAKYCKRWPSIYGCLDNVTSLAITCMDDREKKAFNKSLDIVQELQEFMCYKDGDRLAMFIAEGGVECLKERKDGIQECMNSTLGHRMPNTEDISISSLPTFLFSAQDCADFDTLRGCFNTQLEKCKNSTPANIVDAFFKFLKKHMPCGAGVAASKVSDSGSESGSFLIRSSTLLVAASLLLSRAFVY